MKFISISLFTALFAANQVYAALSEETFLNSINAFKAASSELISLYHPKKKSLKITSFWTKTIDDDSGAAHILTENDSSWNVTMIGDIPRYPGTTSDLVDFVICHELGHLLHKPIQQYPYGIEARSDDWAMRVCLPLIWKNNFSVTRATQAGAIGYEFRSWAWNRNNTGTKIIIPLCSLKLFEDAASQRPVDFAKCHY